MAVQCKASGPYLATCLKWIPIFKWCVYRCGSKNRHQKGIMCLKETGLSAQNFFTILGSVNIIGVDLYDQLMRKRIFTLTMNTISKRALRIIWQMATGTIGFGNHLALNSSLISYEKWVQS